MNIDYQFMNLVGRQK